jgi:hypothetical protein
VILAVDLEIGMNMREEEWAGALIGEARTAAVATESLPERDRVRWDEIQRLFDLCRDRSRDEWYSVLRAECAGRESIAFEVMTLLVAAENLPPIEGSMEKMR